MNKRFKFKGIDEAKTGMKSTAFKRLSIKRKIAVLAISSGMRVPVSVSPMIKFEIRPLW